MSCGSSKLVVNGCNQDDFAEVPSDTTDFYDVDPSSYPRTYNFLKTQKESLYQINAIITSNMKKAPTSDQQQLEFLQFLTVSLINCDFGAVFLSATNAIPALQNIINSKSTSPSMISLASNVLGVTLSLSRIFSFVSCTLPTTACTVSTEIDKTSPMNVPPKHENGDQMLVLCRICEEYVPIEMIEQHSKNCAIAYESEFTMITTDERIKKLQKAIRNSVLNEEWPGSMTQTISTLLPMLHVVMLLDVSMQGDKRSLSLASAALMKLEIPNASPNAQSLFAKAKELMQEKVKAADAFSEASAILQRTRVNGNASTASSLQTSISDFLFVKRISSGAFAKVFLAEKVKTGDIYAIKVTPKEGHKQKNQFRRILTEKDILLQNSNPFIVDFYYSIIGEHNLYLVMEYLQGGDLFSLLHHVGCLNEQNTKTYTVQIIKALEYLHSHGIVHRDLKPDNILIDINGKLKLTDFGLSLYGAFDRNIPDDKSIVGTPDYLAPEIILCRPHSFSVDYWSLGCVIFELLVGEPPFHRDTESETFAQILSGKIDFSYFDEDTTPECIDLIKRLLAVEPEKRIGANGIKEIMDHPWFKGIDWENIDSMKPVFVPEQQDKFGVSYFTERYTFHKSDDIEKDILEDIEIAKTQTPQSVSMTDLSSRSSFASRIGSEEEESDDDELVNFGSIALKNLIKKTIGLPPRPMHKRSKSVSRPEEIEIDVEDPSNFSLCPSKSFSPSTGRVGSLRSSTPNF